MAYSAELAERVRRLLARVEGLSERQMFGGLAFMVDGRMCCGINGDDPMVRVGADAYETALARRHVREMDFTGRALRGMVYVAPAGLRTEQALQAWLEQALDFVRSLPPK